MLYFVLGNNPRIMPGRAPGVHSLNQINIAMGEAAIAATAIHNGLRERNGSPEPT